MIDTRQIRHLAAAFVLAFAGAQAHAFETRATAAYVIDQTTGTVLLNKNADTPLPPASMSKLMTLLIAFEAIRDVGEPNTLFLCVGNKLPNYH